MATVQSSGTSRSHAVRFGAVVAVASVVVLVPATASYAADNHESTDFSEFSLGDPVGQLGWDTSTSRTYDFEIVDRGGNALRLANSTNDPSDYALLSQLFAPRLAVAAGEPATGAAHDIFEMSFTVDSTTGGYQPGLNISVAASGERSDGAQPQNRGGGIVNLTHLDGELAIWTTWPAEGSGLSEWRNTGVSVSAETAHTVRYVVQFVEGDDNDRASLWVDGVLVSDELSSWENYHDDAEAFDKQSVQSPLFRIWNREPTDDGIGYAVAGVLSTEVVEDLEGEGLLIRDLSYSTYQSTPASPPPATVEPPAATDGTDADATSDGDRVDFEATGFDPFENVAVTIYPGSYFAGWFRADSEGRVASTIELPSSVEGGVNTMVFAGQNGNIAVAQFSLVRLAATGTDGSVAAVSVGMAGLLLLFGGVLVAHKLRVGRNSS